MQFIILAALLATLAHSEAAAALDAVPPLHSALLASEQWRLLLIALTALAAPFATACDGGWFVVRLRRSALQKGVQWEQAGHRYERLQLAALWLWLGAVIAMIYVLNWPTLVRKTWQWETWPLIDDALVLSPVIGSLLLVWLTFYFVERTARWLRTANSTATDAKPVQTGSLLAYLAWQCRHYLAMALVPAFIVLAIQDLADYFGEAESFAAVASRYAGWLLIPALVAIAVGLPLLLRRLWPTVDMPADALRRKLEVISQEMQTPLSRVLIWQTQGRLANAAVAGLSSYCRYLFLTDALLVQLAPTEIAAVVRHELGHLQRRHLALRLLLLALPALAWLAMQPLLGSDVDLLGASPYSLAVSAAYLAYAALAVGTYSKWLEYDADLSAVFDRRGLLNAESARDLIHALAVLQGPYRESRFSHLLHPPTANRIAWIRKVLMHPAAGIAYRRRLDQVAATLYAATFVIIGVAVIGAALL